MLKNLVLGHEKPKFVLIEDSVEQSARGLLKAFVSSLAGQHDIVHVYLYEMPASHLTFGLPSSVVDKLRIRDLTVDPFGWTSGTPSLNVMPHPPELPNEQKSALVIDGLTDLVKANSLAAVCRLVHEFTGRAGHKIPGGGTFEQVVSVVHKDVLDGAAFRALEHCARCTVNLCGSVDSKTACRIVRVSDSGKVSAYDECYSITDTFGLESVSIPKASRCEKQPKPAPDPTSNLTFRLTLKETEETARRQLVLPYLSARNELQPDLTGGGKDAASCDPDDEDFDEEDPDDDLDI